MERVVASAKTKSISVALAIMTKTTMPTSVKSTVSSMVSFHHATAPMELPQSGTISIEFRCERFPARIIKMRNVRFTPKATRRNEPAGF